ncbi:TPA: hypothetical protein ACGRN1_001873 [Pseudomonas aeruginosa]
MSIDWSKAPSSATHYLPEQKDLGWEACWYKKDGDKWLVLNCARLEKRGHMEWVVDDSEVDKFVPLLVPRSAFSSEWNGQGLPPVGTVCEYRCHGGCEPNDWTAVHVLAHAAHGSDTAMLLAEDNNGEPGTMYGRIWIPGTCRPLRTPEQIAAEERRNSILHLANILIDSRGQCNEYSQAEAIFDAGYRRQESST